MAIYQWTGGDSNGNFGDLNNWIDVTSTPPQPGEPGTADEAVVQTAGTITGSGRVDTLVLAGAGGLLTADALSMEAAAIVLGGTVAVTDYAYFNVATQLVEDGNSTVTVNDVSYITVNSNLADTGPSTVGFDVGETAGYTSALNLTGFGTAIEVFDESTVVGDAGTGVMTIGAGAKLDTVDSYDGGSGQLILGNQSGGQGTLTVTGAYASLQAGGEVTVGKGGRGYLIIEGGAEASINPQGYQQITPTILLTIGYGGGSTGALLVTGTGSRLVADTVDSLTIVGDFGTGTLTVASHGFVELGNVWAGASGGQGTIDVTGAGSTLELRGYLFMGGTGLNSVGTGSLSVTAGGQAVVDGGDIVLGYEEGSGTLSVSGPHSTLNTGTSFVFIESGTLTVTDGGAVRATGASGGFDLGEFGNNSSGLVSGAGSAIACTGGPFTLDSTELTIAAGGKVTAASLVTYDAVLNLSGAGSTLAVAGDAQLGNAINAATTVSIGSGSTLSAATAEVEKANVSLTGGTFKIAKTLTVDAGQSVSGSGTLKAASLINSATVSSDGGMLSFIGKISGAGTLAVGGGSTLSLNGAVGSGQSALFEAATGALVLAAAKQFAATIEDFIKGDTIDLSGIDATGLSFAGDKLTVHESNGSSLGLIFAGAYSSGSFAAPTSDQHGGTLITHT